MASCLAALLASAPNALAGEATLRDRTLDLLSGYEDPATSDELHALGEGVDVVLVDIASDPSVSRSRRAGATWALGFFPTATTHSFLLALEQDSQADSLLRRSGTWALCTGWGDAALPEVKPALESADPQLRNQAVRAIAKVGTPAARLVLQDRLPIESSAMVREQIQSSLALLDAAGEGK